MENNKKNNVNNILSMDPTALAIWLNENYLEEIPTQLVTVDDLKKASVLLGKLTNVYAYIMSMDTFAKLAVRNAKKRGLPKEEINDCTARRDVLDAFADTIKAQYSAISRMITVKKQIDDEMRML